MGAVLLDDKINHGLELGGILNIDGMCGALGVRYAAEKMYEQDPSRAVEEYARMLNDRIISPTIDPPNPNTSLSPYFSQTPPWMSPAGQPVSIMPLAALQNWHDSGWLEDKPHQLVDWFKRFAETAKGLGTYHQIGCIDNIMLRHGAARDTSDKTDALIMRGPALGIREMFEPDQGYRLTETLMSVANFMRMATGFFNKLTGHKEQPDDNYLAVQKFLKDQPQQTETVEAPVTSNWIQSKVAKALARYRHEEQASANPIDAFLKSPDPTPPQGMPPAGRGSSPMAG